MNATEGKWAAANIYWCEYVVQPHAYSPWIGEFWNTVSNSAFLVAGLLSALRDVKKGLPRAFVFTDLTLVLVGAGSMFFHATETLMGELFDELPMTIMAAGYLWCVRRMHWLTSPPHEWWFFPTMHVLPLLAWMLYLTTGNHDLFAALFTVQVTAPALISVRVGPSPLLSRSRLGWWAFLLIVTVAKVSWEFERALYRRGLCPEDALDWRFWLHSYWHVLSAAAHVAWISYVASLHEFGAATAKHKPS